MSTKIEWCKETWNPVIGCSKISEGCQNCYAERMAHRLANISATKYYRLVCNKNAGGWSGDTRVILKQLDKPLHWKKPRMIFVCSMGDLFHETVEFDDIIDVFQIIARCPQHTFLILTKRPERMHEFFCDYAPNPFWINGEYLPNVWLGVTAENQQRADERIPILLQIPAAIKFVSVEPMLESVNVAKYLIPGADGFPEEIEKYHDYLDWVICGGETGPGARPMHPDWVLSLKIQCHMVGVPFFFKQWGKYRPFIETAQSLFYKSVATGNKYDANGMNFICPITNKMCRWNGHRWLDWPKHTNCMYLIVGKKKAGALFNGKLIQQYPEEK